MVSGCSTLSHLTQNCRVLTHFADDSGAFLETSLLPTLAKLARSKTQGSNSGLLSRGGVVTPDSESRTPARSAGSSRSTLLLRNRSSARTGTGRIIRHFTSPMQRLRQALWAWFWLGDRCTLCPGLCRRRRER